MRNFITLIFIFFIASIGAFADTIDVWYIKINNKIVINSNLMEIIEDRPMLLNLEDNSDNDTVKICYWTDCGLEERRWCYFFHDIDGNSLVAFTNKIDSTVKCWGGPCETFTRRKNYIEFTVGQLRKILFDHNIEAIYVRFKHSFDFYGEDPYVGKNVCIITNE